MSTSTKQQELYELLYAAIGEIVFAIRERGLEWEHIRTCLENCRLSSGVIEVMEGNEHTCFNIQASNLPS